jgi:hypothetical protein
MVHRAFLYGSEKNRARILFEYRKEVNEMKDQIELQVEELEERIAPSANGQLGYEGQPGNQGNGQKGYEGQPGNQGGGKHNP